MERKETGEMNSTLRVGEGEPKSKLVSLSGSKANQGHRRESMTERIFEPFFFFKSLFCDYKVYRSAYMIGNTCKKMKIAHIVNLRSNKEC